MRIFLVNTMILWFHQRRKAMELQEKFEQFIENSKEKLDNDESAFEKLLKVIVGYGMDEQVAEEMIADCITEQYELDEIRDQLADIYFDAKEIDVNNGQKYDA